jgi:hypothetical protein
MVFSEMHVSNKTNYSLSSNVLFYLIVGQAQEDTVISIGKICDRGNQGGFP